MRASEGTATSRDVEDAWLAAGKPRKPGTRVNTEFVNKSRLNRWIRNGWVRVAGDGYRLTVKGARDLR